MVEESLKSLDPHAYRMYQQMVADLRKVFAGIPRPYDDDVSGPVEVCRMVALLTYCAGRIRSLRDDLARARDQMLKDPEANRRDKYVDEYMSMTQGVKSLDHVIGALSHSFIKKLMDGVGGPGTMGTLLVTAAIQKEMIENWAKPKSERAKEEETGG